MKITLKGLLLLSALFSFSALSFEEELKTAIVDFVKKDSGLSKEYSTKMDQAFNFLDPEDPRRVEVSKIENLAEYSLSTWIPNHSFRFGQGDYSFCNDPEETASYDMGTVIVGFDTSYKREERYGFWAVFFYNYTYCTKEDDTVTRSKIDLNFKKWVPEEVVDTFLQ